MTLNTSSDARTLLKVFVLIAIVVLPMEVLSYVAGKFLAHLALIYDPPRVENYANYLKIRDPVLGWPSRDSFGHGEYDRSGSRIVPNFPDPALPSCIALFGDSFTWGDEVTPEYAYGNVLSGLMGCRVANYGVVGYGTDQAYLRYDRVIKEDAPIVILGYYSDNITRNINQERGFITDQPLGLKPRFILEGNQLKLIPLPTLTKTQLLSLGSRAQELLPYDYFAPGGPSGIRTLKFPFTLSVLGAFRHYRIQAKIRGIPSYAPFYDPGHPSQALPVTVAIIKAFVSEAQRRNQKSMVVLIPDVKDLYWLRDHGALPYAELANRLRSAGIVVPEVAEKLNQDLGDRDPCVLYTTCDGTHFNSYGYKRLAEIVFAKLKELGWVQAR
ncbi:MAG: hypothetical protein ACYC9J_06210 [Sulfuricaulis sp.]